MLSISPLSGLSFILVALLATLAGTAIAQSVSWSNAAKRTHLDLRIGIALGPFLLGIGSVFVLWVLPGAPHSAHLTLLLSFLAALIILPYAIRGRWSPPPPPAFQRPRALSFFFFLLLWAWGATLFADTLLLPLNQNDSLEYATVGRILYDTRDLASYPAIHPEQTASGFYGPWTHPPLYVALIYISYVLQGNATSPGLMRLLAPWFTLGATLLLLSLGSFSKRSIGILSALIFISTPLLFLGAQSALIDSLPTLGLLLFFAVFLGAEREGKQGYLLLSGAVLGVALWTHSQAVLFLPLCVTGVALLNGTGNWRTFCRELATLLSLALAIGGPPYVRNYLLFGSPVSDNPLVFALKSLNWKDYFAFSRGIQTPAAIVQYGLLKGWTAIESFGASFWLFSAGALGFTKQASVVSIRKSFRYGAANLPDGPRVALVFFGVACVYLLGMALSILAGTDLMVKNERYLLVILPYIALVAGHGSYRILKRVKEHFALQADSHINWAIQFFSAFFISISTTFCLLIIGWYYPWRHVTISEGLAKSGEKLAARNDSILQGFPNIQAMLWISKNLPKDAVILSLRPADFYYANRKMVSYLDPRLIQAYEEKTPESLLMRIQGLGIHYIHIPDYEMPVSYNSQLSKLLGQPERTKLIYASLEAQVYELTDSGKRPQSRKDCSPPLYPWTKWTQLNLGGRKSLGGIVLGTPIRMSTQTSTVNWLIPLWQRDFSSILSNGFGVPFGIPKPETLLPVSGGTEYQVSFELKGNAFLKIWMAQFDEKNTLITEPTYSGSIRLSELVLLPTDQYKAYSRRFLTYPNARHLRIGLEHVGHSSIEVRSAHIAALK